MFSQERMPKPKLKRWLKCVVFSDWYWPIHDSPIKSLKTQMTRLFIWIFFWLVGGWIGTKLTSWGTRWHRVAPKKDVFGQLREKPSTFRSKNDVSTFVLFFHVDDECWILNLEKYNFFPSTTFIVQSCYALSQTRGITEVETSSQERPVQERPVTEPISHKTHGSVHFFFSPSIKPSIKDSVLLNSVGPFRNIPKEIKSTEKRQFSGASSTWVCSRRFEFFHICLSSTNVTIAVRSWNRIGRKKKFLFWRVCLSCCSFVFRDFCVSRHFFLDNFRCWCKISHGGLTYWPIPRRGSKARWQVESFDRRRSV